MRIECVRRDIKAIEGFSLKYILVWFSYFLNIIFWAGTLTKIKVAINENIKVLLRHILFTAEWNDLFIFLTY